MKAGDFPSSCLSDGAVLGHCPGFSSEHFLNRGNDGTSRFLAGLLRGPGQDPVAISDGVVGHEFEWGLIQFRCTPRATGHRSDDEALRFSSGIPAQSKGIAVVSTDHGMVARCSMHQRRSETGIGRVRRVLRLPVLNSALSRDL